MDNLIADKLRQLIDNYGISIFENSQQFHDLLLEHCPQNSREVFLLSSALKTKGFVSKLLNISPNMPKEISLGQIYFQLQENLYITSESAKWAVKTLAIALNIISPQEWNPSANKFVPNFTQETPNLLNNLIIDRGFLICEEWQKLLAYLNDYSQNINENQLLAKASKIGIVSSLISMKKNNLNLSENGINELIQELENEFFLLPEAGRWVVKTWVKVLNVNYPQGQVTPIIVEEKEEIKPITKPQIKVKIEPQIENRENDTIYISQKPDSPQSDSPISLKKKNNKNILGWVLISVGFFVFLLVGTQAINSFINREPITRKPPEKNQLTESIESPEEFIKKYFALISEGDYQTTWQYIAPEKRQQDGGYSEYIKWWRQVNRVDVGSVDVLSIHEKKYAQVRVQLNYFKNNGKISTESHVWILTWDESKKSWLFND